MPRDVFGRARGNNLLSSSSTAALKSILLKQQQQLSFTKDGNLNLENHRICNVSLPYDKNDVCTKQYTDVIKEDFNKKTDNLVSALRALNKNIAEADKLWDNKFNAAISNIENQIALRQKRVDKIEETVSKFNSDVEILNKKVELLIKSLNNELNELKTKSMKKLTELTQKINTHVNSEINHRIEVIKDEWKELLSSNGKDVDLLRDRIVKLEQLHPERKRLKSSEEASSVR